MSDEARYPEGITTELLMAYADGALDPAETARVEAALRDHPGLAAEVDDYRLTAGALSGAFDTPLSEPVPDHLAALVMGGVAEGANVTSLNAGRMRRARLFPAWGQALAACAVFGFGALFGVTMLDAKTARPTDRGFLVAGRLDASHPIARALETSASARTIAIAGGRFDAVATFPTASGVPCREFEAAHEDGAAVGIACRRDGRWTIELLLNVEPTTAPEGGFQLASGFDGEVIGLALDSLKAGVGLGSEAETCLIENGWNIEACPGGAGE